MSLMNVKLPLMTKCGSHRRTIMRDNSPDCTDCKRENAIIILNYVDNRPILIRPKTPYQIIIDSDSNSISC